LEVIMPALSFDIIARDRASKVFDQVAGKADKTNRSFDKVGSGMGATIGKIGAGVIGLTAGFQVWDKVVVGGFQRFTALENAEKRMDSMGLSTAETAGLMDQLSKTVIGTSFSLDAGASTMANFIAAGIDLDDVNDRLQMTADTAAFAQQPLDEIGNIFADIQTQGKLTGQELNMLQERGVPALVLLADAAGVTAEAMQGMISRGEIDAERFFDLWEKGSKGFGENNTKIEGAAQSMGDTLSGSLANAGTAAARLGEIVADDVAPFVKDLADGFRGLVGWIEEMDEKTQGWNSSFFDMLETARDPDAPWFQQSVRTWFDDGTEGVKTFQSAMDGAKSETEAFTMEVVEAADELAVLVEGFSAYQDALKSSTDPVFAFQNALSKVSEAQAMLNETRSDSEATTADVADAEWALFEALTNADSAAHNADLSFNDMNAVLDDMVQRGLVSAETAEVLRGQIDQTREAAEDYTGPYVADLQAEIDDPAIRDARRQLDMVARTRNPKYLAELDRQAEIRARNRLDAAAAPRSAPITPYLTTSRLTVQVSYAVSGGLPLGIQRQHGGPVEAERPYIVGERGPEWFVPDRPGLVVSNKDAKTLMRTGGGTATSIVPGMDPRAMAREFVRELRQAGLVMPRTEIARRADLYARSG
jgi:tape measure domain-containing protein